MTEQMITATPLEPNKLFVTETKDFTLYEYYFMGYITDPENYIDLCNALRTSRQEDQFVLRFNSGGGQVRTANMILNAIHECEASTIGFIEHDCGSACTFLFLACKNWGVSKYAEFFAHTYSSGSAGKEHETFEASQFMRKQTHKRIREEYNAFLTNEEIDKILNGGDVYLDSDEIMGRLELYAEARELAEQDGVDDEDSFSVDSIIEGAIEKALDKVLEKYNLVPKEPTKPVRITRKKEKVENPEE